MEVGDAILLEYSILNNLVKEGVDEATNIIKEIIHKNVTFKTSSVCAFKSSNGVNMREFLPTNPPDRLIMAFMSFTGEVQGEAQLIFPKNKIREFMNMYLNKEEGRLLFAMGLSDIDLDILKEIGNIILTCVIGKVTYLLSENLEYTLTETEIFVEEKLNKNLSRFENSYVFMFPLTLNVNDMDIRGCIILNLNLNSLDKIIENIYE